MVILHIVKTPSRLAQVEGAFQAEGDKEGWPVHLSDSPGANKNPLICTAGPRGWPVGWVGCMSIFPKGGTLKDDVGGSMCTYWLGGAS